jgi:hypothetical protein
MLHTGVDAASHCGSGLRNSSLRTSAYSKFQIQYASGPFSKLGEMLLVVFVFKAFTVFAVCNIVQ